MLKLVFWVIVGVLALSFFGISLESIITSPSGQENFAYLWHLAVSAWDAIVRFFMNLTF